MSEWDYVVEPIERGQVMQAPELLVAMTEAAAIAAWEALKRLDTAAHPGDWDTLEEPLRAIYRHRAQVDILAALRAAEARGFKLVSRDATNEMIEVGMNRPHLLSDDNTRGTWRAMHDAAPGVDTP